MITRQDFEALGFRFGAASDGHPLQLRGSTKFQSPRVDPANRGVYQATIIHLPARCGAFKLFGPLNSRYSSWGDALCAVFPTAEELYAYLIEQTLRQGLTFTQLAAGEKR